LINSFHPVKTTFVRIENMDHALVRVSSQRESMDKNKQGQEQGEFNSLLLTHMQVWLDGVLKRKEMDKKLPQMLKPWFPNPPSSRQPNLHARVY
jgi:hypothetical protein